MGLLIIEIPMQYFVYYDVKMRQSFNRDPSMVIFICNALVRLSKLLLDLFILRKFIKLFIFFLAMKKRKLAVRHDRLSPFNIFIVSLVFFIWSLQFYRVFWYFFTYNLSLTNLCLSDAFRAQFVLHVFLINPTMDLFTFLSIMYLFYTLHKANE